MPARLSRLVAVESYEGVKFSRIAEDAVVGTPRVHKLSFAAYGIPSKGPSNVPMARGVMDGRGWGGGEVSRQES